MSKDDNRFIYYMLVIIFIIDSIPLLFPYPYSHTYLSENPNDNGQIIITYNTRYEYFNKRTIPLLIILLFVILIWESLNITWVMIC